MSTARVQITGVDEAHIVYCLSCKENFPMWIQYSTNFNFCPFCGIKFDKILQPEHQRPKGIWRSTWDKTRDKKFLANPKSKPTQPTIWTVDFQSEKNPCWTSVFTTKNYSAKKMHELIRHLRCCFPHSIDKNNDDYLWKTYLGNNISIRARLGNPLPIPKYYEDVMSKDILFSEIDELCDIQFRIHKVIDGIDQYHLLNLPRRYDSLDNQFVKPL